MADTMTDITLEQRARELLAAECRTRRYSFTADNLDEGNFPSIPGHVAIAAVAEALRLSAGADWVLVPREPTEEMARVFRADIGAPTRFTHTRIQCADFASRYRHMLAAAPRHETGEVQP